jgi:hypothetical protein
MSCLSGYAIEKDVKSSLVGEFMTSIFLCVSYLNCEGESKLKILFLMYSSHPPSTNLVSPQPPREPRYRHKENPIIPFPKSAHPGFETLFARLTI